MDGSLIQRHRMGERRRYRCKALSLMKTMTVIKERNPGQLCASSRGNTEGVGVIHDKWAYRVRRLQNMIKKKT